MSFVVILQHKISIICRENVYLSHGLINPIHILLVFRVLTGWTQLNRQRLRDTLFSLTRKRAENINTELPQKRALTRLQFVRL